MSKHRIKVLGSLNEENIKKENKVKRPSEISNETELTLSDVSRTLRSLKENGLVICLNEKQKQGRLYEITKLGKKVLKNI
jgi:DNA-binding transcriptional ArsR family regulator